MAHVNATEAQAEASTIVLGECGAERYTNPELR
jgi:hypothetical protein